jgi:single-strand DNA-binding protein
MYQNRATLIGFLGKDAEVRTTQNTQARYTVLSLATKRSWRDRESGERLSQTTWHRCIVWGKLGEFAETLTKGAHVQIEGDIRTREYTQRVGKGKKPTEVKRTITDRSPSTSSAGLGHAMTSRSNTQNNHSPAS